MNEKFFEKIFLIVFVILGLKLTIKMTPTLIGNTIELIGKNRTSNTKKPIIPSKYINRKIHPYPFWCEEYLIINENYEFTRVEYNSRVYQQRESVIIKGKLNFDGTITFFTTNEWHFGGNTHKTKMLDKWEIDDWGGENNIQFKFFDYGYSNKTSGSGWEKYDVWYRDDECN